ncbi:MAG: nuclear transport factor 2 family protein [Gemmatimonadota bacterium]|nr:nuclear transport factor 2 family protein [Gemmatimonadota bacterium]
MRSWFAISTLALGLTAGVAAGQTAEEREIIDTLEAMWAAIEAGDADAYAEYVHPDFTQFGENDTYLAQGKDLEVAGIRDYVSRASNVHTDMHQPVVTVRGDVAWIVYYWTDSGYSGGERFASRGKSTRIFVRENGRWLCIHGHYTAVP